MRPVSKGKHPTDAQGAEVIFAQYSDAAPYLKKRLGRYCSYCERKIPASLAVEHVIPKSTDPQLTLRWNNFLLACVNCNSNKGNQLASANDCLWPDIDDTFSALFYSESGSVQTNPNSSAQNQQKAKRLIDLVGLNKLPDRNDHRWDDRLEAWGKAKQAQILLNKKRDLKMIDFLIISAKDSCWSIWMTVFKDDSDIQQRLVAAFPGTRWGAT